MEQTRRFILTLIGIAVCGCMICTPTPTPTPTPIGWEPMGSAMWTAGTLGAVVDSTVQSAGQGGNHLEINVTVGSAGLSSATEVRIAAFVRLNGTQLGSTNRVVTLDRMTTNDFTLNVQICPSSVAVVGQELQYEIWAAREGDHQLLERKTGTVTPACGGGSCGACR
ncbi:MAG: hypothetical protein JNM17_10090 [Archangium sp.]|nr:hypothetical protein [Archangium sp.]